MQKYSLKLAILFFLLVAIFTGCERPFKIETTRRDLTKNFTLEYWRVYDGPDSFSNIIAKYNALHPNITIKYVKKTYAEYEKSLLNAFAEDRAPDIFSIQNTWVKKYENKIKPLPAGTTMAVKTIQGAIKKEEVWKTVKSKTITPKGLKDTFADVVYNDVVYKITDTKTQKVEDKIMAIPLSVDTLAMYYNRDLLDAASITKVPQYWNNDFLEDVKKLTKQDRNGIVTVSGVALGGSKNIERYSDILALLMMQNGATMMEGGKVMFNMATGEMQQQKRNPGLEALRFYTDFANSGMEVYSWNEKLENSLKMFYNGQLALMFGYSYHLPAIKSGNPKLNYSVAKFPQIENSSKPVNFANYWVETVSFKSKESDAAWDFIQFAAKEENVKSYLEATKKPTALRSLVNEQTEDPEIGVFASQVLTAKSWYRGYDFEGAEQMLGEMIDNVASSSEKMIDILNSGASKVQQTINQKE